MLLQNGRSLLPWVTTLKIGSQQVKVVMLQVVVLQVVVQQVEVQQVVILQVVVQQEVVQQEVGKCLACRICSHPSSPLKRVEVAGKLSFG